MSSPKEHGEAPAVEAAAEKIRRKIAAYRLEHRAELARRREAELAAWEDEGGKTAH